MTFDIDAETFEAERPTLMGVAYRVLGSTADAADAVQDTYLAWMRTDKTEVRNPKAWLITVCSRRAIDLSTAASRRRVDYVGQWLPDFVHTPAAEDPAEQAALSSSVTTAFLLLLERLTPKERAAYVLREVFGLDYAELAAALEIGEPACRQLVARAKRNVGRPDVRHRPTPEHQQELLDAFRAAVMGGAPDRLTRLLADDVVLTADGGGKVPTALEALRGRGPVLAFVDEVLAPNWRGLDLVDTRLNGAGGLELVDGDRIVAAVSFAHDTDGRVTDVFIMRNPDKLALLDDLDLLA